MSLQPQGLEMSFTKKGVEILGKEHSSPSQSFKENTKHHTSWQHGTSPILSITFGKTKNIYMYHCCSLLPTEDGPVQEITSPTFSLSDYSNRGLEREVKIGLITEIWMKPELPSHNWLPPEWIRKDSGILFSLCAINLQKLSMQMKTSSILTLWREHTIRLYSWKR